MKKILLLSTFAIVGITNAKSIDLEKGKKEGEKAENKSENTEAENKFKMQCYEWSMFVWCTGEFVGDTVCWGPGSGTPTYEQAVADEIHNSQLFTEFHCGQGTGSGWGTGNGGH